MTDSSFILQPVAPFRLDLTVWTLRRRPHNAVDRWDGRTYRRVLLLEGQPVAVAVTQTGPRDQPELLVQATGRSFSVSAADSLTPLLNRLLGLKTDLTDFYRFAAREPRLRSLAQRFRGARPPRFPGLFEALVNGIACQQLSLDVGLHLLNRLAAAFGVHAPQGDGVAFPRPGDLADSDPEALRALGYSRRKGRYIIDLARGISGGEVKLEPLAEQDDQAVIASLQKLKGVGRWTAEYVLLRGLGRWHVFPGDDVGARRKLQDWLGLTEPLDYQGVRRVLERWRPFGGLLYFHFLLHHLAAEGHLA